VLYKYQKHDRRNGGPLKDTIIYAYYYANFTIENESYGAVAHKANKSFNELRRKFQLYTDFGEWRSPNCWICIFNV
jgi:hypothetical protein